MQNPIYITAFASISPLGKTTSEIWESYTHKNSLLTKHMFNNEMVYVGKIAHENLEVITQIQASDLKYKNLDPSVLYALYASRKAIKMANWQSNNNFGVNIGSSRGATHLFETYFEAFLKDSKTHPLSSPTTTLGNISSWVAHDLQTQGPEISHSITCSSALHALLNGIAWLNAKMSSKFLVGGTEAALTPFTIAQMKALKVYAKDNNAYPCRALDLNKTENTMVLGEGAAVVCLEKKASRNTLATIIGYGYATEILKHNTSISTNAECFQKSMAMALANTSPDTVDVIVMHAPGTLLGDTSELNAISKTFQNIPALTTNKWKIGHSFGASGMLSIEMALLMLANNTFIPIPYLSSQKTPKHIKTVLINAVGFGGNAVSILLKK